MINIILEHVDSNSKYFDIEHLFFILLQLISLKFMPGLLGLHVFNIKINFLHIQFMEISYNMT